MKQFAAADQRHVFAHQAKARLQPADRDSAACRPRPVAWRQRLSQAFDFGFGLADDEHVLPARAGRAIAASSSSRTLAMSPLNRSTDSMPRWQVVSNEPIGTLAAVTEANRTTCRIVLEKLWTSCGRSSRSR